MHPSKLPSESSFECISRKRICDRACLNLLNIYRPPSPASSFFSELHDLLLYIASLPHDLVLMGAFNLHIKSSSSDVRQLSGISVSFDVNQNVVFLPILTATLLILRFFLQGVTFCPYHRLMPFLISFPLLLI